MTPFFCAPSADGDVASPFDSLLAQYRALRQLTEALCAPLAPEDHVVQSMPDASPAKWHLAHTSWFFETFVLAAARPEYQPFHPHFCFLFNSYYNAVGERLARPSRGLLTRPTVADIYRYRAHVDEHMGRLLESRDNAILHHVGERIVLGLNHEQQHQELILTDVKHLLASNPLRPTYRERAVEPSGAAVPSRWLEFPAGLAWIGHDGAGFCFDNELPRHQVYLHDFRLASRSATCGEFRAFLDDGGYDRPELWLSDGWSARCNHAWRAPLYWEKQDGAWSVATLNGFRPIVDAEPVCHVSYYEADAYARWAGARLPTEAEWEAAAGSIPQEANLLDSDQLHPVPASSGDGPRQFFGDVWEWTGSAYLAYPGYRPLPGALGEYNGKFMCNQFVLRGGSCVTPRSHIRASYRNFFPPEARWQFTGIRLARDV
jgi:ergothioneine biosynthesis protein EgtB